MAKSADPFSVVYEEGFEGEVSGWTVEGTWAVGEPTSGPGGGFESSRAGATDLSDDYPNDSDARLISPSISLPEVSSSGEIRLHFREWYEIESGFDEGGVEVSTDGGSTWTQLSNRSGSSDWRDTQVDLTSYAGEEVKIAFRFTSDSSITFPGWYVDDVQVSVDEPDLLSANITGLSPQKFPFIFSNVEVDTSGSGIGDLSGSNFEVYENGTLQTDQFEVVPPEEGGGLRQTDVVFIIDNTGSMGGEISQVRDNVISFVDSLESSEIDFSLGLVTYKDDVNTYFGGTLTENAAEFQETVGGLSAAGGGDGPENSLGALQVGLNSISFRPGSQKVFVLITDATSHTPPAPSYVDPEPPTLSEINQSMNEAGVTTYAAGIDDPIYKGEGSITNATGGNFFFVTESFDSILDDIGEEVSDSYVLRYRSSNDDRDGSERTVRVEVNYEGNTAQDTASYVAGGFPQIVRT
ncbi:MAG: VWA domain-containing protein, partial [Salinibacter sp.]|uniref:VWA domain-containing protein n=1 Tax=Salinibacter sp. TaxID=2065818 RepID=UPI002FC2BDB8